MTALVSTLERSGLVNGAATFPTDAWPWWPSLRWPDYIQARRQAGVEVFAQLIDDLPADEADALSAAVTALTHLQRLDEERRSKPKRRLRLRLVRRPADDHGTPQREWTQPAAPRPLTALASPLNARIVVGIDGSDTSWDAFCWACGETNRLDGRTVAVFVGPTSGAASATAASFGGAVVAYGADPTDNDRSGRGTERPGPSLRS
jgi:hypothetical protein